VKLSPRYFRRLIEKYLTSGNYSLAEEGGCYLSFPDCPIWLREHAIWNARTCMIEYIFVGEDWTVTLLESPNQGKRLLLVVSWTGDSREIERSLLGIDIP
jgi:hypothetical protein